MPDMADRKFENMIPALVQSLYGTFPHLKAERFAITLSAHESAARGLIERVLQAAAPSLEFLFLESLNEEDLLDGYLNVKDAKEERRYLEWFSRKINASEGDFLKHKAPTVAKVILRTCHQYVDAVQEMLCRLDASYDEIASILPEGLPFHRVADIRADQGDLHENGRSTTLLTTDAGKIVYKPHDVRIDRKMVELVERFFPNNLKAPKVCCGDGYGFAEYIKNQPAGTFEEAGKYFYNLGTMACIVQMLGSTDLHHNNVLACNTLPVIIDCELLMTPGAGSSLGSYAQEMEYSLLFSSLMPSRKGKTELSILFGRDAESRSAPVVDGRRLSIADAPEPFFTGYRDTYRRCLREKDALKEFVSSMKGIPVRHIYRGTGLYYELRKRVLEPNWLSDPNLRNVLFRNLSIAMKRSGPENADAITASETEAILRGDIPYMQLYTDGLDLYSDGQMVFESFFRQSCVDHALSRIDAMNETDRAFEEALLRKAIYKVITRRLSPADATQGDAEEEERVLTGAELLERAENIFLQIAEDAVVTPSGRHCWFGPDYHLETGMHLLRSGLVDGTMGLAVFFAAIGMLSGNTALKGRAESLIREIMERQEMTLDTLLKMQVIYPNLESISMSDGLAGKMLGCRLVGRYSGDKRWRELCRKMIRAADRVDLSHEGTDIFGGTAGLLKVLCKWDDLYALEGAPELCRKLADRIIRSANIPFRGKRIWRTQPANWAISGAGHGQSGVASALYLAGHRLRRPELVDAAMAGFDFEREVYSPKLGAWPDRRGAEVTDAYMTGYCSGAPGIGLNALETAYDGSDAILERALESVLKEPILHKDFLCCGNSAVVEFLLQTGIRKNRPETVLLARRRMARIVRRADRNGTYHCVPRSLNDVFSPGLFYGVAGIGYEMLRLSAPDRIENVLL